MELKVTLDTGSFLPARARIREALEGQQSFKF